MEESGRFRTNHKFAGLPFVSVHLDVDTVLMSETPILTAREAIAFVAGKIFDRAEETAVAIFYDNTLAPLCVAAVGRGGTTDVVFFSPRDIVQTALLCNASYVTLLHNHPGFLSGRKKCEPSKDDIAMTDAIIDVCNSVGVKVYDSIVVSAYKERMDAEPVPIYYSIREHNFRKLLRKNGLTYKKQKETEEDKLSFERGEEHNTRGGLVPDITRETEGILYHIGFLAEKGKATSPADKKEV